MIYTITLNPAMDRTLRVEKIRPDDSNRIAEEQRYAGGKGIDVSRVLTTLGPVNKALGFVGGFAGEELEGRLLNEGIACDFVRISGETRTNIIVNEASTGNQTVFNAKGPEIRPYELMQMIHKVEKVEGPEIVAISGSLPPGVHPEIYRKIIGIFKERGARVLLDTDGDALKVGIQGLPDIIKPNIHELGRLVGQELQEKDEIISAANSVLKQGTGIVLVSMGAEGILLIAEKEQYIASPPVVKIENTIGAGDSAVAGFVYGLSGDKTLKEALVCAVAAGTATTLRPGTALCRKEDFLRLVPQIILKGD
ncbi:MAG TPA: 1-phosphofructokinase [Nitrospirae bacterium]|nr:1-phosphofructokinase [Nitrospirota bacterium]HDZ01085.1 1-phosphofructokinase [Nitrospirota bacterium]